MKPLRNSLPDDKLALVALAAAATLGYLLVVRLVGFLIEAVAGGQGQGAYSVLAYVVAVPFCAIAYRWCVSERNRTSQEGASRTTGSFVAVVLSVAAGLAACAVGMLAGDARTVPTTVLNIACLGIAAPVAEELLFRGAILGTLDRKAGPLFALVASSLLFGVAHIGSGGAPAIAASGVAGLLFGGVYLKTRSVAWPIAAHAISNLATFALSSLLS